MVNSRIYILSIVMLLIGIALPIIVGYMSVPRERVGEQVESEPRYTYTTLTTIVSMSGREEPRHIPLNEGYSRVIELIENVRKTLLEVQKIMPQTYYAVPTITVATGIRAPIPVPAPTPGYTALVAKMEDTYTTTVSRTNVQVEGVDEADIVKNSDRVIAIASQNRVYIFDVVNRRVASVINTSTAQGYSVVRGLYLYGDKLVVITSSPKLIELVLQLRRGDSLDRIDVKRGVELTTIYIFNVSDIYSPILVKNISVSGSYLDSRLSDSHLYIIATVDIYGDNNSYIVPLIDGGPIDPDRIIPIDELPTVYTIMVAIDLESLEHSATAYMTGYGFRIYMSINNNLYIASPILSYQKLYLDATVKFVEASLKYLPRDVTEVVRIYIGRGDYPEAYSRIVEYLSTLGYKEATSIIEQINSELSKASYTDGTRFYMYSVNGVEVSYRGMFTVNGSLLDQFCMEEYGGRYFIVATTSTERVIRYEVAEYRIAPPSYRGVEVVTCSDSKCTTTTIPIERKDYGASRVGVFPIFTTASMSNNVYVVDIEKQEIVGKLDGLAEGERIYAARLVKNIFFLVTFRQVDPLFAINISDPLNPEVLGYLKIPGFSEYLHPLPNDMLLGIGLENDTLKISLFNVSNPVKMEEISTVKISSTWSPALQDHHAVTVYLYRNIAVIPAYMGYGAKQGFIILNFTNSVLKLGDVIDHSDPIRSVYIGNKLFTISNTAIKIYDLDRGSIEEEVNLI